MRTEVINVVSELGLRDDRILKHSLQGLGKTGEAGWCSVLVGDALHLQQQASFLKTRLFYNPVQIHNHMSTICTGR